MRRSTAAAVGTLTGAALIVGVRLSVSAPVVTAAPPAVDLAKSGASPNPTPSKKGDKKKEAGKQPSKAPTQQGADENGGAAASDTGLKDGSYRGKAADYAYGTIQVSITVDGGKITAADATYPIASNSATINPPAIAKLKQSTLQAQSADVNAVSGATLTSAAYVQSLQAALDQANG